MAEDKRLKELKARYDNESIQEIILKAQASIKGMRAHHKASIDILYYLERTGRWREYPGHEKATFVTFLSTTMQMSPKAYYGAKLGYYNYQEATEKYGAGIISEIRSKCGADKVTEVLKAIEMADNKKTPISLERIKEIINEHAKPKKQPRRFKLLCLECPKKDVVIVELRARIVELEAQLERAKAMVLQHMKIQEQVRGIVSMPRERPTEFAEMRG